MSNLTPLELALECATDEMSSDEVESARAELSALKSIHDDFLKLLQAIIIVNGGTVTIPFNVIAEMPKDVSIERVDGEASISYRIATRKEEAE